MHGISLDRILHLLGTPMLNKDATYGIVYVHAGMLGVRSTVHYDYKL